MERGDRETTQGCSAARKDLIILIILGIVVFALSAFFNVRERIQQYITDYEFLQLDEIFVVAFIFVVGFAVFAVRRWQELKIENRERRNAEAALTAANKKLSLLNSITRHDIINQLLVLRGFLSQSLRISQDEQPRRFILKELEVAERINRQILFTKEYQDIGVQAPVWQNAAHVIHKAQLAGGTITLAIGSELDTLEILADRLLEKVFFNLVDNAVRHGGEKLSSIRFSAHATENTLLIFCEDDGCGIPEDEKNRIFEQGYGKNTGYGLFLIREILSITGITIRETGVPGEGARFEIMVPSGYFRKAEGSAT